MSIVPQLKNILETLPMQPLPGPVPCHPRAHSFGFLSGNVGWESVLTARAEDNVPLRLDHGPTSNHSPQQTCSGSGVAPKQGSPPQCSDLWVHSFIRNLVCLYQTRSRPSGYRKPVWARRWEQIRCRNKLWWYATLTLDVCTKCKMKYIREKQVPYDFTYMGNLKNKTNKQNRHELIDPEKKQMVARGKGVGVWGEKGEGVKKYKLVATEQSWGCEVQHRECSH